MNYKLSVALLAGAAAVACTYIATRQATDWWAGSREEKVVEEEGEREEEEEEEEEEEDVSLRVKSVAPPKRCNDHQLFGIKHGKFEYPFEFCSFSEDWNPRFLHPGVKFDNGPYCTVEQVYEDDGSSHVSVKAVKFQNGARCLMGAHREAFKLQAFCNGPNVLGALGYWESVREVKFAFEFARHGCAYCNIFPRPREADTGFLTTETQAATIIRDIARGLQTLHERGVVHSDVHLFNIMVCNGERTSSHDRGYVYKLSSFHRALKLDVDGKTNLRSFNTSLPGDIAPELARRDGRYGPEVDMYALGRVLQELLDHIGRRRIRQAVRMGEEVDVGRLYSADGGMLMLWLKSEDPSRRPSPRQVLEDPWIRRHTQAALC